MKYKTETHIVIDARKLDILLRLGCSEQVIFAKICGKNVKSSGDKLIDETLDCLVSRKTYTNWGGARINSGKKSKKLNQVENQVENQDGNQVENQVETQLGTITHTHSNNINTSRVNNNNISTAHAREFTPPTLEQVLAYAAQQNSVAGMGGFKCTPQIAEEFWSNYESTGWVVANDARTPVRDWQAKLRQWALRQARMPAATPHESAREQKNRMAKEKLDKWLEQVRQNAAKEQGSNQ